jgi:hypothetical protein
LRFDATGARPVTLDIEVKDSTHPDDGVRLSSAFEFREFERRRAIGEQAPAGPTLLLRDPVSFAVAADHENRRLQTRGRFR